jgi:hypothetical protein
MLATGNLKGGFENNLGNVISDSNNNAVNNQEFEKGDILVTGKSGASLGKVRLATSGDTGPFYFCKEDKAETATIVHVLKQAGQRVYVVTDNTLTPFCKVKPSTANDGHVMKLVEGSGTADDTFDATVGIYQYIAQNVPMGGAGTAVTNATAGTVVAIDLVGGG